MATNDFDSDAMLAFIGELTKRVTDLKKELSDIGAQSGTGMRKAGDEVERFGQSVKRHAGTSVKEMNTGLKEMATNLLGPVGIAVGIYKVGQAMESFAVGQIRMQNFARDAGYSTRAIKELQLAAQHMGYSVEEANGFINNFGDAINNLKVWRQGSQFWQDVAKLRDGGYELARTMDDMSRAGKDNGEIMTFYTEQVVKQLQRGTEEGMRTARAMADAARVPLSFFQQLAEAKAKIDPNLLTPFTKEQLEKQKQLHSEWINEQAKFWQTYNKIVDWGIEALIGAEKKHQEFLHKITPEPSEKNLDEDARDPVTGLPLGGAGRGLPPLTQPFRRSGLDDDAALPRGARPISFAKDELIETEKDSRAILEDIRNILDRLEAEDREGGGGGTTFRPGIRAPGGRGGEDGGGGGGARPSPRPPVGAGGDGGSRPSPGPPARSGGGGDGGAGAGVPLPRARPSIEQGGAPAPPVRSPGDSPEGGGADAPAPPAGGGGAAPPAAGGAAVAPQDQPPPSAILRQAREIAIREGPAGVARFMRENGYPKSGAWCGQFAAAVITRAGGTPPRNPQVASNWRNYGQKVEGAPQPGDVAVRRGARTGSTGSHVTIVEEYDPKTGTFTGVGGNQGRGGRASINRYPTEGRRGYDFYRQQREQVDNSLRGNNGGDLGGARITVDFNGVPKDVKTDAELMDTGIFKTLKLSRTAGQAAMAGSTNAPQNNWTGGE